MHYLGVWDFGSSNYSVGFGDVYGYPMLEPLWLRLVPGHVAYNKMLCVIACFLSGFCRVN